MKKIQAPFRYDYVGSFLRPERLKKARADYKNVSKEVLEKLDYLIGNALRDQDVENRLPQIQREIESSLQVGV